MEDTTDVVDATVLPKYDGTPKRVPSIECLNSEMPGRDLQKDKGKRAIRILLNRLRLRKCASVDITEPDPTYKVAYLGNVVTGWAKGEGCVEKPLATLWRNYTQSSRPDVRMQLTVSGGGLKATTKDHGLTEYWANRLTYCSAPPHFPRLFCWIYRHEGRRLRHELRCHAVLCSSAHVARQIETKLKNSLALALAEFRRDKISRQNARLSLVNSVYDNPSIPRRKILLSTGSQNYRPPLERSKSAPKLTIIEEHLEESDDIFEGRPRNFTIHPKKMLRHCDSASVLLEKKTPIVATYTKSVENCDSVDDVKKFCEDDLADERSDMILKELLEGSLRNDLIESCNINGWLRGLSVTPDLIPATEGDDGSLSSGCESASTVTSDLDQPLFNAILEAEEEDENGTVGGDAAFLKTASEKRKSEPDFKVGGSVLLSGVRGLDKLATTDIRKYCFIKPNLSSSVLQNDEVSLVPVGETQTDFSSLKVFKKRAQMEQGKDQGKLDSEDDDGEVFEDDENASVCSDESGYEEIIDCASSVSNIVLV